MWRRIIPFRPLRAPHRAFGRGREEEEKRPKIAAFKDAPDLLGARRHKGFET
jgi:hypothetical protein